MQDPDSRAARHRESDPLPLKLLAAQLPYAERDEFCAELRAELASREERDGRLATSRWLWLQLLASTPSLFRLAWWRGRTGWEPQANRLRPGGPMLESWIMDLRYAVRRLRTRPVYGALAVLTLALGVGGLAAIAGIARTMLVAPLPYHAEEGLAAFWMPLDWTEQEFLYMRGRWTGFSDVALYRPNDVTLQRGDAPARVVAGYSVSANLFDVLGANPAVGTTFRAGDDVPGAEPVAVISFGLWQELGGTSEVIGQQLQLGGVSRRVIGVMPRGFWFPDPSTSVWTPEALEEESLSGNYALVGRLAPGQTIESISGPLAQIVSTLGDRFTYPEQWDKTKNARVEPLRRRLLGDLRVPLVATVAAMGLILLIACANVAALMLGQVEGRATEIALRSALGADRRRLTQQLLAEALLLGATAGVVGAGIAAAGFGVLVRALPLGALAEAASLDWRVFAVAFVVAIGAALLISLTPVFSLWRGNLRHAVASARSAGIDAHSGRAESGLVVAEVALAVLMVAGTGLLVRSVAKLYAIDPGFQREGVGVLDVVSPASMPDSAKRIALNAIAAELATTPGVASSGSVQWLPLRSSAWNSGIEIEGRPDVDGQTTLIRVTTTDYLQTMGIPMRAGRGFVEADRSRAPGAAAIIINESLARKFFSGNDPIGLRISTGFGSWGEVVGVVADVAEGTLKEGPAPTRYELYEALPFSPPLNAFVVRAERPAELPALLDAARRAVQRAAPSFAVQDATTMDLVFQRAVGASRQIMLLLLLLSGLALVLGAVGVYGVIAHFASRRRQEWGVRMALGMEPGSIVRRVVGRGTVLAAAGAVIGLVAVVLTTRLLGALLYDVAPTDPVALVAAVVMLLGVAAVAALIPAWRASRIDPASVLREQ